MSPEPSKPDKPPKPNPGHKPKKPKPARHHEDRGGRNHTEHARSHEAKDGRQ